MSAVRIVNVRDVDPIELPAGSWSKMLIASGRVEGNATSLGTSTFTPGTVLADVCHETEEAAYVVSGAGELRLEEETVPFGPGDALHIPAGVWHSVAVTGDEDVVMVFGFAHPEYPPTERR